MTEVQDTREETSDPAPIDCYAAMRKLWDYLDEELTEQAMGSVRGHLAGCAGCYEHYEFALAFLAALARVQREDTASPDLRHRVMSALRADGFEPRYGENP